MNVADAIARRYSCRAYRGDPVPVQALGRLAEAVRLAPSACNRQPWRLAFVTDPAVRRRIVERGFQPGIAMSWALEAPVLAVFGMVKSVTTHRLAAWFSGVDYPWLDLGIAGEHLVLQATELGLDTCWIGWIRPREIRRLAGWPAAVRPVAVISVGYAAEPGGRRGEAVRMPTERFVTQAEAPRRSRPPWWRRCAKR